MNDVEAPSLSHGASVPHAPDAVVAHPRPVLSVFAAMMITVGIVVGAGIFQTPALVASIAGSPQLTLLVWILGGLLSFVGALTYAELATAFPSAGGEYAFLTRAFGRKVSFLFAWARATVIVTGSIGLIGFILGDYLSQLFSLGPHSSALYAALAVILLTAINLIGLHSSSRMQNVLTVAEVSGVLLIGIAGLVFGSGNATAVTPIDSTSGAFGLALVFVLLTYGGWNEAAYVSAELRGGTRAICRTLFLSIAVITVVYVVFVLGLLSTLGFEGTKASEAAGADAAGRLFGETGARIVSLLVALSALTSMNSTMIVGARSNYALAADWPILRPLGQWHGGRNSPAIGFVVQALIALALIGFGAIAKDGFSALVEFTAPVFWFFFMLTGLSLFVLRRRQPQAPRPFRVPLYPWMPLVFVATCAYLLYSSIRHAQTEHATSIALGVMMSGALVLAGLTWHARTRRSRQQSLAP